MTTILEKLAAFANAALPGGIAWDEQTQAYGSIAGSVDAFRDDPNGKAGYIAELYIARTNVVLALEPFGIDARMNLDTYQAATDKNTADITANEAELGKALLANQNTLSSPVAFNSDALRDWLGNYVALLETTLEMHTSKLVFELGWTEAAIAAHADALVRQYRQLKYLLASGALDRLKPEVKPLVGITYVAGIAIGVGVVLLVAIIAGAIIWSRYNDASIAAAKDACLKMIEAGRTDAGGMCGKLAPSPLFKPVDTTAVAGSLLTTLVVGGVVLGGLWMFLQMKKKG